MNRDDIATQLRQRADLMGQWLTPEQNIMLVAADEIERLRAELKTEQVLSFRNQVATLEAERDAAVNVIKACLYFWDDNRGRTGIAGLRHFIDAIDAARGKA